MSNAVLAPPPLESGTLRVIPLGGLGEVGRNMTIFELDGKILVVDCGVLFPEEHQPGVDPSRSAWTTSSGSCSLTVTKTTSARFRTCSNSRATFP